jgi:hypothetical protein
MVAWRPPWLVKPAGAALDKVTRLQLQIAEDASTELAPVKGVPNRTYT